MDFISHLLIGGIIALLVKASKKTKYLIVLFSILPDLFEIPLYLFVGSINARVFWIPNNADWIGFRVLHPVWTALWDIPHSLLFLLALVLITFIFKLPRIFSFTYAFHIFIDIFTHTGEWNVKLFWPLQYSINGFTDSWAWPLPYLVASWLILGIAIAVIYKKKYKI
jgi:hypothetical protein